MNEPKKNFRILIVEDNQSLRDGMTAFLKKDGFDTVSAEDGKKGLNLFSSSQFHLVITDIRMPELDGIELFKAIKSLRPATEVILITAYASVDIAVETMKYGAEDFITKPFSIAELRKKVEMIYNRFSTRQQIESSSVETPLLIGQSPAIEKIRAVIEKVAKVNSPILITGESGTGKELVAWTIHQQSFCHHGPFVAVNCGALNENLLESELFGHEKGSFTGAVKTHVGKFEISNGGTLFLDEIGEMSPALQVKVLRVLQTKQFHRVGGENPISSDFRLIAATNKDLQAAIRDESFRSDLFYRINVIPIFIPPLRERKEDIPLLIDFIIRNKSEKLGRKTPAIDTSVIRKLTHYSWHGNIRELENFLERALIFIEENRFSDDLFAFTDLGESENGHASQPDGNLVQSVEKIEREMIVNALRASKGVKQHAADALNIKTGALYYKIDKYGIEESEYL
ncbi:MAG: Fis family transcriptional regulator [Candidatus Marinimicrobia bacterium CG08_land_8_20_14_0_20_45_22]|nr:MAG: Fis family transcriptional regulator [Candidatus Marinimicrobia bacterium CG08_land_8_20_14_0_20_45_22]